MPLLMLVLLLVNLLVVLLVLLLLLLGLQALLLQQLVHCSQLVMEVGLEVVLVCLELVVLV